MHNRSKRWGWRFGDVKMDTSARRTRKIRRHLNGVSQTLAHSEIGRSVVREPPAALGSLSPLTTIVVRHS